MLVEVFVLVHEKFGHDTRSSHGQSHSRRASDGNEGRNNILTFVVILFAKIYDWMIDCILSYFSDLQKTTKYWNYSVVKGYPLSLVVVYFSIKAPKPRIKDIC